MATHEATVEGVGVGVTDEGERGTPVVLVRARDELLPIFVSPDQAQSMQHAIDGTPFERPLTHDLLVDMVAEFGAAIDRVRIDDLSDGTFYAKIDTEQYNDSERTDMVFDARPSDGIALALRVDCPIIVSDEVLDQAGRDPDELGFVDDEGGRRSRGFDFDEDDEATSDTGEFGFDDEDDDLGL